MSWNRQRSAIQNHEGKEWLLSADGGSCEEDTLRRAVTFSVRTQTAQGDCIGKETGINTLSLQDHLSEGESLAEKEQEAKHGEWVWGTWRDLHTTLSLSNIRRAARVVFLKSFLVSFFYSNSSIACPHTWKPVGPSLPGCCLLSGLASEHCSWASSAHSFAVPGHTRLSWFRAFILAPVWKSLCIVHVTAQQLPWKCHPLLLNLK